MILHPGVIALLVGSLIISLMTLYSARHGLRIIRHWDLGSGSELQIGLEKTTYLISTVMTYAFGFLILSFFLFIFTAEDLHRLFVGAMCAAGTLNVNGYGYPALVLMSATCILAGLWLIINHADNQAIDYPLIKRKYLFLIGLLPFIVGVTVLLILYFVNMKANVITSCCGALFSAESEGAISLYNFPAEPMMAVFFGVMAVTLGSGAYYYRRGGAAPGALFSVASVVCFLVSVAALLSFISLYFYELPTHHCPFCILQSEYHYVGYFIYVTLLGGVICGAGVGLLTPFRGIDSLRGALPRIQKKLTLAAIICYGVFTLLTIYQMIFSDFILLGYQL